METVTALPRTAARAEFAAAGRWAPSATARPAAHAAAAYATDTLHPAVYTLAAGSYAAMLAAFWLLFATDTATGLSLVICAVYFAMFFGVPAVLARVAAKDAAPPAPGSLGRFLRGDLATAGGPVGGHAALAQVVVIPVAVTFGVIAIGLIFRLAA